MLDIHYRVYDEDDDRDEEAYNTFLEALGQAFVQAPEGQALLKTDPHAGCWAAMFLRYYFDYIGSSIADITAPDAREVLFELLPRKVSVEPDAAPEIVHELRAFLAFLGREFGLPHAGEIQALLDDQATLKLKNQLADPRNYGMAKSFFMAGQKAGFDMTTEEGSAAFMLTYNASLASRQAPRMPNSVFRAPEVRHTSTQGRVQRSGLATARTGVQVGRNDPCPCDSGKKFKKCCAKA